MCKILCISLLFRPLRYTGIFIEDTNLDKQQVIIISSSGPTICCRSSTSIYAEPYLLQGFSHIKSSLQEDAGFQQFLVLKQIPILEELLLCKGPVIELGHNWQTLFCKGIWEFLQGSRHCQLFVHPPALQKATEELFVTISLSSLFFFFFFEEILCTVFNEDPCNQDTCIPSMLPGEPIQPNDSEWHLLLLRLLLNLNNSALAIFNLMGMYWAYASGLSNV